LLLQCPDATTLDMATQWQTHGIGIVSRTPACPLLPLQPQMVTCFLCRAIIKGMRLKWGNLDNGLDAVEETSGSFVEAISLFAYLIVWSLTMAAFIGVLILTGVVTLPLVLVWVPCFLWSKAWSKVKPQRSGHGPKARLLR
jgi:hypothetical protein